MAAAASSGADPPKFAILITYVLLGCAISFLFGREPGRLPEDIALELAPSIIVIGIFLTHYSLWDCMAVGAAKQEFQKSWSGKIYREYNQLAIPEQVYLAQRVQSNQVEQLPVFLAGILSSAMLVNGLLAATMGLAWSILRMRYAYIYRHSVGMQYDHVMSRLVQYTIPAYFLSNSMLVAATIHALRLLIN